MRGSILDFPVTREILKQFPDWVEAFAATLPIPERARLSGGDFQLGISHERPKRS